MVKPVALTVLLLVRLLVQIEHRVRALVAVILTLVKIVNLNFLLSVRIGVAVIL